MVGNRDWGGPVCIPWLTHCESVLFLDDSVKHECDFIGVIEKLALHYSVPHTEGMHAQKLTCYDAAGQ